MSRIDKLPKYKGFPVPYIVYRDAENIPHFKINDHVKVYECLEKDLCSICGEKLDNDKWLIGGPMSAFHPHGAYVDSPVHKECGVFALQTCPYMAFTKYKAKIDVEKLKEKHPNLSLMNYTQSDERLPYFVFIRTESISVKFKSTQEHYIYPKRPYLEVEYWKDGAQITEEEVKLYNHESV